MESTPSQYKLCSYCKRGIPIFDLEDHEFGCLHNPKGVLPPEIYKCLDCLKVNSCLDCLEKYDSYECSKGTISYKSYLMEITSSQSKPCSYCKRGFPIIDLKDHEFRCLDNPNGFLPPDLYRCPDCLELLDSWKVNEHDYECSKGMICCEYCCEMIFKENRHTHHFEECIRNTDPVGYEREVRMNRMLENGFDFAEYQKIQRYGREEEEEKKEEEEMRWVSARREEVEVAGRIGREGGGLSYEEIEQFPVDEWREKEEGEWLDERDEIKEEEKKGEEEKEKEKERRNDGKIVRGREGRKERRRMIVGRRRWKNDLKKQRRWGRKEVGRGEKKMEEEEKEIEICVICVQEYVNGEKVKILACCHKFHKECIGRWLLMNSLCPLCKKDMKELMDKGVKCG